jgi:hypothetical protein
MVFVQIIAVKQLFKRFWTNGKYSWRKKRTFWPYSLILRRLLILLIQNFSSLNSFTMDSIDEQYAILKPLNLLPYKYRILFRFSTFCFKILNNIILKDFFTDLKPNLNVKNTRCMTRNLFNVPRSLTLKSGKILSIYAGLKLNWF